MIQNNTVTPVKSHYVTMKSYTLKSNTPVQKTTSIYTLSKTAQQPNHQHHYYSAISFVTNDALALCGAHQKQTAKEAAHVCIVYLHSNNLLKIHAQIEA